MPFYLDAIAVTFKSGTSHQQKTQTPKKCRFGPRMLSGSSGSSSAQSSARSSATASIDSDGPDTDSDGEGCQCWLRRTKHRAKDKKKPTAAGPRPHTGCLLWRKKQPAKAMPEPQAGHGHGPQNGPKHRSGHHHGHHNHANGEGDCCRHLQLGCPVGTAVLNYLMADNSTSQAPAHASKGESADGLFELSSTQLGTSTLRS